MFRFVSVQQRLHLSSEDINNEGRAALQIKVAPGTRTGTHTHTYGLDNSGTRTQCSVGADLPGLCYETIIRTFSLLLSLKLAVFTEQKQSRMTHSQASPCF